MRLQKVKWIMFVFIALTLLVFGIHFTDRAIHCKMDGLSRDEALKVANWKLGIQFRKSALLYQFKLTAEQVESDKSWIFTYRTDDCVAYIIVDKCGVTDVGGLSKNCVFKAEKSKGPSSN